MSGRTINVKNSTELTRAIKTAVGGDTILLAPGNYGAFGVNNSNPSGIVTIRSANPADEAVFDSVVVSRSSNYVFQDLEVAHYLQPGESDVNQAIRVQTSRNITFVGLDVHGTLNNNPNDDGNGFWATASERISVLDSSFRELNNAVVMGRSNGLIFAGNTITTAREGMNLAQASNALVERNYISQILPNAARGDHGDAIQLHAGGTALTSSNIVIRGNVLKPGATGTQGILIGNEKAGQGLMHSNITIDNNYYEGNARHGISVVAAENVTVTNNTVRDTGSGGLVPAIIMNGVRNGVVDDNIAPMFLGTERNNTNSNIVWSDNIDVWDRQFRVGVSEASLFASPTGGREIDFSALNVRAGTAAANQGIGFAAFDGIGDIKASAAAVMAAYLPQFDCVSAHIVMV